MLFAAEQGGSGSFTPLLLIVLLFGVMYFMMIRPQQKKRREAVEMQSRLSPGDEIVTIGGLHGVVAEVGDEVVSLEVSPGVVVRFARPAIARVLKRDEAPAADVVDETAAGEPVQSPVVETKKITD